MEPERRASGDCDVGNRATAPKSLSGDAFVPSIIECRGSGATVTRRRTARRSATRPDVDDERHAVPHRDGRDITENCTGSSPACRRM
jgi:hypothetical protein